MSWEFSDLWNEVLSMVDTCEREGVKPKLHPQGFIQLDLSGDRSKRLHIWEPSIPRTAATDTMHNHVWKFKSTVLCGTLFDIKVEPKRNLAGNWEVWQAKPDRHVGGRGGKILQKTGARCAVDEEKIARIRAGETYSFRAFDFHDSVAVGYTATLFQKGTDYGGDPLVICKRGQRPDNELPSEATPEFMWSIINRLREVNNGS